MRSLFTPIALSFALAAALSAADLPKPKAEHVILCIWDGMRPDFITPENAPNLSKLATSGTFFANNHSFYVTTTEVNGTVLATGAFPAHSTIVANREYRPEINPKGPVATESPETIRKGDELTRGKYLGVPTVAEIVAASGQRAVIAGTKPVALLHARNADGNKVTALAAGKTMPPGAAAALVEALGEFPQYAPKRDNPEPNIAGNRWTTRALLEQLWREDVPKYSVLWLSDPDFPQHVTAPGSPTAIAGVRGSDEHLGMVLAELEKRGLRDKTDIFVVSDHGFSTTGAQVDPVKYLNEGGVRVVRGFTSPPQTGDVLAVNVGGSTGLYIIGHDQAVAGKVVALLQASDFAGAIFAREALPGTFPLADAHLQSPESPDIVFAFRWTLDQNEYGVAGRFPTEGRTGAGMHGTPSPSDIHNTLVGAGPDIRVGYRNEFPTGNIDVAPTLLHLLGLSAQGKCDGRILTEALAGTELPTAKPASQRHEATQKLPDGRTWTQYLQTTIFADKTYLDEANGSAK